MRVLGCSALLTIALGGCGGDPPGDGFLLVVVTSEPGEGALGELTSVRVEASRVDVVHRTRCEDPDTERVLTVAAAPITVELTSAAQDLTRFVAHLPVPPGCVLQVRLIVADMGITVGSERLPVRVPSGAQTGIKVVPEEGESAFPIVTNETTAIHVRYDPNRKLVINRGQGVLEMPVLTARTLPAQFALGIVLDEIVVTFARDADQDDINEAFADCGGTAIRRWPFNYVTVKLPTTNELRERLACWADATGVAVALPNTWMTLAGPNPFVGTPNDDAFVDPPLGGQLAGNLAAARVPEAWAVTTGDRSVLVAVVDNGFEIDHPDLDDNVWINEREVPESILSRIDSSADGNPAVLTFADLRAAVNRGICPVANSGSPTECEPSDLVDGTRYASDPSVCAVGYGFQDGCDNDGNGLIDDVIGWDFDGVGDNLPLPPPECCRTGPGDPSGCSTDVNVCITATFHGTAVAGVVTAEGNNSRGVAGVMWNSRLMLVKGQARTERNPDLPLVDRILRDSMVRGLEYAHIAGARVINLSMGLPILSEESPENGRCPLEGINDLADDKLEVGVQALASEWHMHLGALQDRAVLVVATANCAENLEAPRTFFYPAFVGPRPDLGLTLVHSTMITVTALRTFDDLTLAPRPATASSLAPFASFGVGTVLMAAPGDGWVTLDPSGTTFCAPQPLPAVALPFDSPPNHVYCSGSSFAAPMVAGAAGLVLANNVGLSAAEMRARILDNAGHSPSLTGFVAGERVLDVAAAVGP